MIKAYILVNVKPGKENLLIDNVKKEEGNVKVVEYDIVYGEYDVIIKVEGDSLEDIRRFVLDKIRVLDFVERTVTLISAQ